MGLELILLVFWYWGDQWSPTLLFFFFLKFDSAVNSKLLARPQGLMVAFAARSCGVPEWLLLTSLPALGPLPLVLA